MAKSTLASTAITVSSLLSRSKISFWEAFVLTLSPQVENKVIVTVSLGAPRTWIMQEKKPRGSTEVGNRYKWILENGSLLVMQGDVQKRYTHEIPKEAKVKESRIVSEHR